MSRATKILENTSKTSLFSSIENRIKALEARMGMRRGVSKDGQKEADFIKHGKEIDSEMKILKKMLSMYKPIYDRD